MVSLAIFSSPKSTCLLNRPFHNVIFSNYSQMLPGHNFELDPQCELEFGRGQTRCTMPHINNVSEANKTNQFQSKIGITVTKNLTQFYFPICIFKSFNITFQCSLTCNKNQFVHYHSIMLVTICTQIEYDYYFNSMILMI